MSVRDHLQVLLSTGLPPQGHSFMWHHHCSGRMAVPTAVIALAYYAISFQLLYLVYRGRSLRFRLIYSLFAIFILACGTTHLLECGDLMEPRLLVIRRGEDIHRGSFRHHRRGARLGHSGGADDANPR